MRAVMHVFQLYTVAGVDIVWWRFLSPNGRCLARCPGPLASVAEARLTIASTIAVLDRAEVAVRSTPDYRWRWTLVADGEVVARGSGAQDRRVRCELAARRFVLATTDAVIDPTVHTFRRRDSGRARQAIG